MAVVTDELFTVEEVAQKLKLHTDTVKRLLRTGQLTGYKILREWRVKQSDLDKFMEDRINKPQE